MRLSNKITEVEVPVVCQHCMARYNVVFLYVKLFVLSMFRSHVWRWIQFPARDFAFGLLSVRKIAEQWRLRGHGESTGAVEISLKLHIWAIWVV